MSKLNKQLQDEKMAVKHLKQTHSDEIERLSTLLKEKSASLDRFTQKLGEKHFSIFNLLIAHHSRP